MLSNKNSSKKINLTRTQLYCHPDALNAFKLSNKFKYSYLKQLEELPTETIEKLSYLEPIHVVVSKNLDKKRGSSQSHYQFFSGWFWLPLCRKKGVNELKIIIHSQLESSLIEEFSWLYMLSCEFKCMQKSLALGQMYQAIEQLKSHQKKELFGKQYSWSSNKIIQNLTLESFITIKRQAKQIPRSNHHKVSIFDQLLKGS